MLLENIPPNLFIDINSKETLIIDQCEVLIEYNFEKDAYIVKLCIPKSAILVAPKINTSSLDLSNYWRISNG